ncbi:hypothetical protein [Glycomyces buryatensis]|uniref:Uncharacterized protein n=1 Tax=Glycomyces buryatensis TaxID=2570927 RepID=A0A4S8PRT2_9ACTN|nr:hypothetical protein [Glycomyces buryatensis]THV33948.1 hypothetical protein FAB82_24560 [Glycomyces buryatensis]
MTDTNRPPARTPSGPATERLNAATRHLCAGAHIDDRFRNRVLGEVYDRPELAVAPNPGIDTAPVLRHMLFARSATSIEYAVTAVLFIVCILIAGSGRGTLLTVLLVWGAATTAVVASWGSAGLSARERARRIRKLAAGVGVLGAAVAVLAFYETVFAGPQYDQFGFRVDSGAASDEGVPIWVPLLILLTVNLLFGLVRVARILAIRDGRPPPQEETPRLTEIAAAADSPVISYASGAPPFVGFGDNVATWQIALLLKPGPDVPGEAEPESGSWDDLDAVTLNRHLKTELAELAHDTEQTVHLPGLTIRDQVFVSGLDVTGKILDIAELSGATGLPVDSVEDVQTNPVHPARHYLRCQVASWDGELVTTVFVHSAFQGGTLYLEFSSYVLAPTRSEYHVFGRRRLPRSATRWWGGLRAVVLMPALTGYSVLGFADAAAGAARRGLRRLASASVEPGAQAKDDLGAQVGLRELGASTAKDRHAQSRDAVKYTEILERQALEAVLVFLEEHGVDVDEMRARRDTIVNHGVINYGNLTAGVIGRGATANIGAVGTGSTGTVKGAKQ